MHLVKLAIFDMAGTVVNENNVVYKTLHKAIFKKEDTVDLKFVLKHGAGKEKFQAIKDIFKAKSYENHEEVAIEVYDYFKNELCKAYSNLNVESFPKVELFLKSLMESDIKVALNTGYDLKTAQLLLDKMNWKADKQYHVLVTADDVTRGRPNPDMILEAMTRTGISNPSYVLKAGDSIIDIEEGKNAKCGVTVGVTTGAHTKAQLNSAQPTYVVDSLFQLKKNILLE